MGITCKIRLGVLVSLMVACMDIMALEQADSTTRIINGKSVVDEVIWVVGDEAILKSDVEAMRKQAEEEGTRWTGDPDCVIPEQLAVQKLYLHQAAIDSIEVTDADVAAEVEQYIEYWTNLAVRVRNWRSTRNQPSVR